MSDQLQPVVGDFLAEPLWTDTVVYEVIKVTPKTITVRSTRQGQTMKTENRDGNPYPVVWTQAVSDPDGHTHVLKRRLNGTFRFGHTGHPLRPATIICGVPVSYTDYRV